MKLFRVLSVPANKFSVFLRYTRGKIGLRTRGYVVRGNMFRDVSFAYKKGPLSNFREISEPAKWAVL